MSLCEEYMEKVYAFTNENLTSFQDIYNYKSAKVLSVLGSGDQYFSALLFGAKQIDLYDINPAAWDYFLFKYQAIRLLPYHEFYEIFIHYKCFMEYIYEDAKRNLKPSDAELLDSYKAKLGGDLRYLNYLGQADVIYRTDTNIPYFGYKNYGKLQEMLQDRPLPKFYLDNLLNHPWILNGEHYDLVMASNILQWLGYRFENPSADFKKFLLNFNCDEFQALYTWDLRDDHKKDLLENGYDINEVPCSRLHKSYNDYVISLRRNKK